MKYQLVYAGSTGLPKPRPEYKVLEALVLTYDALHQSAKTQLTPVYEGVRGLTGKLGSAITYLSTTPISVGLHDLVIFQKRNKQNKSKSGKKSRYAKKRDGEVKPVLEDRGPTKAEIEKRAGPANAPRDRIYDEDHPDTIAWRAQTGNIRVGDNYQRPW